MGTHRLIFIRTDGNRTIATGHLMRCLSIARACLDIGMEVCFLVSDQESKALLTDFCAHTGIDILPADASNDINVTKKNLPLSAHCNGQLSSVHLYQVPNAVSHSLNQELPVLLPFLQSLCQKTGYQLKETVFFLDSYAVTEAYLTALKGQIKTAYLDDLQLFDYPADLVINYDIIPETAMAAYQAAYKNAGHTLIGGAYTPLRNQFQAITPTLRKDVKHILLTTGGSDAYHFCLQFLDALRSPASTVHTPIDIPSGFDTDKPIPFPSVSREFTLHIVVGKLNTDKEKLYSLSNQLPYVQLHENVTDMASLMSSCDLAVSAAGTTLYELCALGIPAISYTMADNQLSCANAFADTSAIPYAGDIRKDASPVLQTVFTFMTEMSESEEKRRRAGTAMRQLVDGNGAARIAEALLQL